MITTTRGLMDESLLKRVDSVVDNDNEHTTAVEYWDGDECVHRSVHVHLKRGIAFGVGEAGGVNA